MNKTAGYICFIAMDQPCNATQPSGVVLLSEAGGTLDGTGS